MSVATRTTAGTRARRGQALMRAAVLAGPGKVRIEDRPVPIPAPGQVRIRLEGCGVCGSNVPVWEGRPWFKYPLEPGGPGHEGYGIVDALGPGVSGIEVGQRVGALTYHAFAEYDLADASQVVALPRPLDHSPFPAEALGCAVNVWRRSGIKSGSLAAVVGVGFLGALLAQMAARAGAKVIAISRRPFALEIARSFGVHAALSLDEQEPTARRALEAARGSLCDVVIEAAGAQQSLDLAAALTKERGRLVVAGFHQDGKRQVDMFQWNWRGLDVINAHERDPAVYVEGMRRAVDEVAAGRLDPSRLYTHTLPLSRLGEALELARTRPAGFLKALVTMGDAS